MVFKNIFAKLNPNFNSNLNWGCVDFIPNFSNHSSPPHPHQKSNKSALQYHLIKNKMFVTFTNECILHLDFIYTKRLHLNFIQTSSNLYLDIMYRLLLNFISQPNLSLAQLQPKLVSLIFFNLQTFFQSKLFY